MVFPTGHQDTKFQATVRCCFHFVAMDETNMNTHEIWEGDEAQGYLPGFEELQWTRLSERGAEDAG